tara:strand:- start:4026 stop:5159 length:1134 start_codon:yes stop_codon:yes gene_type:complete
MGTGYTRTDTTNNIAEGGVINASDLDGEFDALLAAFVSSTGHTHDGTAAEGAPITVVGPAQDYVGAAGDFSPKADSTYDLGKTATRWAVGYLDDLQATVGTITTLTTELNTLVSTSDLPITKGGTGAGTAGDARTNLGLGTAATTASTDYAAVANNLSDLSSAATAVTNLGITATAAELNLLDGVTATTVEINILDGVTSTAVELNLLDGVTSTTAELNILDGVTATATELNYNDITTLGSSEASKTVTADANGDVILLQELKATSYNESYVAVTSTTNATTVDCEAGNTFMHTLTENTTFTFSNPPATGTAYSMSIEIIQDAGASGFAVTWPTSVDWPAATAPTLTATASAKDVFVFTTRDGGTTWYGFTAGQALA